MHRTGAERAGYGHVASTSTGDEWLTSVPVPSAPVLPAPQQVFPADPPRFLARTPYGYHDPRAIARDLAQGGFMALPEFATVTACSRAASSRFPAIGYCQGTPLRNEIEARDASRLGEVTDAVAEAIAERFGRGAVDAKIQAQIVTVAR